MTELSHSMGNSMGFVYWQLVFGLSFVFGLFALEVLYKKFQAIQKRVRSFIK